MNDQFNEHLEGERSFLHDISNQLVIAQGMASYVRSAQKKRDDADIREVEKLEKSLMAMDKMISLVKNRRSHIISEY